MDCSFSQALTKIVQCLTAGTNFEGMDSTVKLKYEKTPKMLKRVQYHRKIRKSVKVRQQKVQYPPFTYSEDQRILELVLELGPKFQEIHKFIPDRTLSLVKNRYYKHLRYNWNTVLGRDNSKLNCKEQVEDQVNNLQFKLENTDLQIECQDILSSLLQKMSVFFSKI